MPTPSRLPYRQHMVLGVVADHRSLSVAEVDYHLRCGDSIARSSLAALERKGFVARNYTARHDGLIGYDVTSTGRDALIWNEADA